MSIGRWVGHLFQVYRKALGTCVHTCMCTLEALRHQTSSPGHHDPPKLSAKPGQRPCTSTTAQKLFISPSHSMIHNPSIHFPIIFHKSAAFLPFNNASGSLLVSQEKSKAWLPFYTGHVSFRGTFQTRTLNLTLSSAGRAPLLWPLPCFHLLISPGAHGSFKACSGAVELHSGPSCTQPHISQGSVPGSDATYSRRAVSFHLHKILQKPKGL